MAEGLIAFLIAVATDEERLERFLKDPRGEAVRAGLSREEIATLMTRNAHRIFEAIRTFADEGGGGGVVWICMKPAKAAKLARSVKRTAARRKGR